MFLLPKQLKAKGVRVCHTGSQNGQVEMSVYGARNMTKLFEHELCKFELQTSVI